MKKLTAVATTASALFALLSQKVLAIECGALGSIVSGESCKKGTVGNDASGQVDLYQVLSGITTWVIGILVIVIILVIIVSGVQLAASAGNPDAIKTAKNHIFNAILGLVLLISMYGIFALIGIVHF